MTQETLAPQAGSRSASLRYLPGIDGLRAVSVLAVLMYHNWQLGFTTPGPFPGGFMGVEVFFVISGYLITSLLLDERRRTGAVNLAQFWMRRARRLLPALFLLLAVVTIGALLFYEDAVESLKGDVLAALTYTSNWWQIFSDRSYIADSGRPPLLNHLWSLAIEEQFYLLWPPILVAGLRRFGRQRTLIAMIATAFASALLLAIVTSPGDASDSYFFTVTRLSGLLLGGALAFVWAPYRIRGRTGPGARWVLDAAGLVGLAGLWWSFRNMHFDQVGGAYFQDTFPFLDFSTFRGGFLFVDFCTLLVIAAVAHRVSDWGRILGIRPLKWIGQRSYGIYLWHYPIFAVTRPNSLDNTWWPWLTTVVRFALTIGIAELSYRFVESPIRHGAIARYVAELKAAHGLPRRRLASRGALIGAVMTAAAVLLGGTLANAEPGAEKIHGSQNFDESAAGDEADPSVLAAFGSTTTLAPGTTATTIVTPVDTTPTSVSDPTVTPPPATVAPETTPPIALTPPGVLGVGDSVMLGAKGELTATVAGMGVDAVVSRQFAEAIRVFEDYKGLGYLPPTIVVHLGTNGRWNGPEFDHMMEVIGPDRKAYFVTARMPRTWEAEVNGKLTDGVSRHPDNAKLIDWRQYAGCHADWFASDGFHVTDVGAQNYANFVNAWVTGQEGTLNYCP
ncbi:MAG: acyltransferase family protein [Actinomycetota bacterium]|nr:acyltransferase family protein [Actinomycetota bacterium]